MRVSVIIPTFNRRAQLERTLPTVLDQTYPGGEYEVIVVVDGSTDGTAAALRSLRAPVSLRILEQPNRGQAAARNAGLSTATGDLVLFLDDDLFCERDLVARHVAGRAGTDELVFGPVLVAPESPQTLATEWMRRAVREWLSRLTRSGVRMPADAMVLANSSVGRDILVGLGGFDEQFIRAHEDRELGLRLWKAGVNFRFQPAAVTHQLYTKSPDDLIQRDAPRYGAYEVLLCRKHPEFRRHSQLAGFTSGTWRRRKAREIGVRWLWSIDPLLRLAEWATRAKPDVEARIFNSRQALSMYRSAVKAAGGWKRFERDYAKTLPSLLYHHVGPSQPGAYPALTVDPGKFKRQMAWLKRHGYRTIQTRDWLAWCLTGRPLPAKPVLLTFDDAYADLAEYAFPVLQENGFTCTVFVVTGEIGGSNSWDQKNGSAAMRCLNADQIRHWAAQGMEFGAHSRSHADLTTIPETALDDEMSGSGRDLTDILGPTPLAFAYPRGEYNEAVLCNAAKDFSLAVTCDEGLNGLGTGPLLLRRTMVQPGDTLLDFAMRLENGYSSLERLRLRFRPRSRLRGLLRKLGRA